MALFFGILFGAIGSAYFLYGKKTTNLPYLFSGVALILYTYFFDNPWVIVIIGAVLMAAPFAIERGLI